MLALGSASPDLSVVASERYIMSKVVGCARMLMGKCMGKVSTFSPVWKHIKVGFCGVVVMFSGGIFVCDAESPAASALFWFYFAPLQF